MCTQPILFSGTNYDLAKTEFQKTSYRICFDVLLEPLLLYEQMNLLVKLIYAFVFISGKQGCFSFEKYLL